MVVSCYLIKYAIRWFHCRPLKPEIGLNCFHFSNTLLWVRFVLIWTCHLLVQIVLIRFLLMFGHSENPHFVRSHLSLFAPWRYFRHLTFPWCSLWTRRTLSLGGALSGITPPSCWYDNILNWCLSFLFSPEWKNIWYWCVVFGLSLTRARSFRASLRSYCLDRMFLCLLQNLGSGGIPLSITLVVTPRGPQPARLLLNLSRLFSVFCAFVTQLFLNGDCCPCLFF